MIAYDNSLQLTGEEGPVRHKKRYGKCLLAAAVVILVLLSLGSFVFAEPESLPVASAETPSAVDRTETVERTADAIIGEIVSSYARGGDPADEKLNGLLAELSETDRRQGQLWADIMDYWQFADTELRVNTEALPDGLPDDDSLCIVVLGYALNRDGTMQQELIERLTTALACAGQYPQAYVLCTGGGTASGNPGVTEAGRMGEWLLSHGLEEERLIIEDKSLSTPQNASLSCRILHDDYPQVDSVVIVSSEYHVAWGSLLFEAAFLKSASEDRAPEIHVISNCGCPVENPLYRGSEIRRWETVGLLELFGRSELAMQFYYNYDYEQTPPPDNGGIG